VLLFVFEPENRRKLPRNAAKTQKNVELQKNLAKKFARIKKKQ